MIVTTGNEVSRREISEYLGVVRGIVVRAPSIPQKFLGGLKQIIGGQIQSYTDVCEQARRQAFDLMVENASRMGADAIVGMRYDATEFSMNVTEVLAYGTAVKLS
ncbi:MAG: YbjQ family protein [Pirellulales bacterium]